MGGEDEPATADGTSDISVKEMAKAGGRQAYMTGFRHATEAQIQEFFKACGGVIAMCNKHGQTKTVYKRETVLCTFKKDKALAKALTLSGTEFLGHPVKIGVNTEGITQRKEAEGSERVFVGNLPFDVTPEKVEKMFSSCGTVLFVRFAYDDEKQFRGFCHVTFKGTTGIPVEKALELDGAEFMQREIKVGRATGKQKRNKGEDDATAGTSRGGKKFKPAKQPDSSH